MSILAVQKLFKVGQFLFADPDRSFRKSARVDDVLPDKLHEIECNFSHFPRNLFRPVASKRERGHGYIWVGGHWR